MNWDDRLPHFDHSDIGMRRFNNQDARAVKMASDMEEWKQRGHFFMVADGMGAHAAGELASRLAVEGVQHLYFKYADLSPPEALQKAIVETNGEIHRRGQANSDFHNMGTTASALVILPQGALIAHIGDSRVYRLRNDRLHQLTRDHSLVWELREQLAEDSDLVIPKNVITRSLGPNPTVQVDIEGPLPIEVGDTFLVCSDGLTGRVTDEELASVLGALPPREAVHLLIDLANLRGGPDNITVIIAKVVDPALATGDSHPLTIGARRGPDTAQPAVWVSLGVCFLGALVLAITGRPIPALVAVAGAVAALLIGLMARKRGRSSGVALGQGRRFGRCPYTETSAVSGDQSVILLRDIVRELRTLNDESGLLDWPEFDAHCESAQRAEAEHRHADAMRDYSRAIRYLMGKVRARQEKQASDSMIDY